MLGKISGMKVLHVVNCLEMGGLEKVVVGLTQHIDKVQHTVVCLIAKGDLWKEVEGECLFLNNPSGLTLSTIPRIKKIIQEKKIDIVHTHNQGPQFYGAIAGKLSGKAVIHTKHGQNVVNSHRRYYLDRFSSFFTDKIVTVSDDARDICLRQLKIPEKKVVTVLNGVDIEKFHCFTDKAQFQQGRPFVIGTVGRLASEKNHSCLLDACTRLADRKINFQLKIVGDGPLKNMLINKCKKLNLQDHVDFVGSRLDIPVIMNEFDLFVLPSLTEGVSLTLLEAMSCELAVVATNVGGTPEVVVDGETGFLVPSNSPDQLADSIFSSLISPQRRLEMGRAGRARVVTTFSLTQVAEKYLSFYRELLDKKH